MKSCLLSLSCIFGKDICSPSSLAIDVLQFPFLISPKHLKDVKADAKIFPVAIRFRLREANNGILGVEFNEDGFDVASDAFSNTIS